MAGFNQATLIGNLGKDPEIRRLTNGDPVASFSIATNETWKDKDGNKKESVEWHNIVVFGALAGVVEQYVKKGSKVFVQGKIKTRKWQDKSGADRWTTEIVLSGFGSNLVMLDTQGGGNRPPPAESDTSYGGKLEIDDEVPF